MVSPRALAKLVAASALAGYLVLGRAAGDVYPLSTFSVYAGLPPSSGSRIGVRDLTGLVQEVTVFDAFHCDAALDGGSRFCAGAGVYTIDYADREAFAYVASHPGEASAGEDVDVVRRIFRFTPGSDEPVATDCVITHCQARRR